MAAAIVLASFPSAADAHITGGPIGITDDLLYQDNGGQWQHRCVYNTGNCSLHSFTFASANVVSGSHGAYCGVIYYPWSPPYDVVEWTCLYNSSDPARICLNNGHDGGGPLHCVDQDSTQ